MKHSLVQRIIWRIFDTKPPPFSRYYVLNLLGMQWWRMLALNTRFALKARQRVPVEYQKYLDDFERDGYAIIPNFLPPDVYARFKAEYAKLTPAFERDGSKVQIPHADRLDLRDPRVSEETRKTFLESPLIMSIARAFLRRENLYEINGYLTRIYVNTPEEVAAPQNGGTNNLHFDSPFRIMKAFYYVNDVSEKNAAFTYARGTQRRDSLARLWFEYVLSVRYAVNKWRPHPRGEYVAGDPWVTITDNEIQRYHLETRPVSAPGNTLVLGNPAGYHKRGSFTEPGERQTVEINFRNVDTLRNYLKSLFD